MNFYFQNENVSIKLLLLALSILLVVTACSKDATIISNTEDGQTEGSNEDTSNESDDTTVDTSNPTTGTIVFESNLTLDESRSILNYIIPQSDYDNFLEGNGDLKLISEKVYEYVKDDFDFIIILSEEEEKPDGLFFGRSTLVQNQIEGLGGSMYNNASSYGSTEKLKSIIYMPKTEYIRNGPFLHEIAHTWGNKGFIETTVGGHWGYASTAGQLGGFDTLEDLGNNTYRGKLNGQNGFGAFANGGNSIPYGNLELYLMGLIDGDELEDIQLAINPEVGQSAGEFTADEIQTLTSQNLIATHGERLPSVQDSQKAFKALAVIISTAVLESSKMDEIKLNLENFSKQSAPGASWGSTNNFWMATQGKASFDFSVLQENIK